MNKNTVRKKRIKIFITVLITIQGLYVVSPFPDIWPFSNYSMFSKANPVTAASNFEFYGLTNDGKEILLDSKQAFLPLDRIRLKKGVTRILNREYFVSKQEENLESTLKRLRFLPADHSNLKESIRRYLLPYNKNGTAQDKEKELGIVFDYLLSQYEHNREIKLHDGPPIVSMNLYLTKWDWTNTPPRQVVPETKLVYSSKYGLSEDE